METVLLITVHVVLCTSCFASDKFSETYHCIVQVCTLITDVLTNHLTMAFQRVMEILFLLG